MTRPTTTAFTEILYARLAPLAVGDEERDWDLLVFCLAIAAMFDQVYDLVRDTDEGPGWSPLLDPARAQTYALPWLAHNVAGVDLTPGLTDAEQRAEITNPAPYSRCTVDAMRDAIQKTLTGTKTVHITERTSSAWTDTIVTRPAETPDADATYAAALTQKPAGRLITHVVTDLPLIDEGTLTIDASTGTIDTATLADIT